jgi:hypothetical protein
LTSSRTVRRIQFRVKVPIVDTDYGKSECMKRDKSCPCNNYRREYWTIDGKITCARLTADEPAKDYFEILPE